MKKTRLLFVGASLNYQSGLSYVLSSLMKVFKNTNMYDIGYVNLTGDQDVSYTSVCKLQDKKFLNVFNREFPIYNAQIQNINRVGEFDKIVLDFNPDIVFSIHDPWLFESIAFCNYRSKFFWAGCCTIETPYYPKNAIYPTHFDSTFRKDFSKALSCAEIIIPVTKMGQRALKNMGLNNIVDPVYLGLDFDERYIPAKDKKTSFGNNVKPTDFVFMTMGRNISRKKLDMVVLAFNEFLKTREDRERYKLYIHTNVNEHKDGTDILTMVVNLGIASQVIFPKDFLAGKTPPISSLYERYSDCHCYIGLPAGEGFGYGFAEAMMHEKPIIYIDYGGHAEYLKDRAVPVKVENFYFADYMFITFALPDISDAVLKMNWVVDNYDQSKQLGSLAYTFAKENFDWKIVGKKFINTIETSYNNFDKSLCQFNIKRIV